MEIFAGLAGLSAAISRLGYASLPIDIDFGDFHDVLRPVVRAVIRGWITSHAIAAVWIATPCTSWSTARRGPPSSGWGPLRSASHLEGLPDLRPADQQKVLLGNQTRDFTAWLVQLCVSCGVPVIVENPIGSRIWSSALFQRLRALPTHEETIVDMCGFNEVYRKRTRLWSWCAPDLSSIVRRCRARGSCSFSGVPHQVLSGRHPTLGKLWTLVAQPYPLRLCEAVAELLTDHVEENEARG